MIPGIIPGMAGQTGPTATYLGAAINSGAASTYNFASQPLGTVSPTRLIVVAYSGSLGAAFSVSSTTIAGIAGTYVIGSSVTSGSANVGVYLYQAIVPTGTTGTISITWSRALARSAIGIWSIDGILSTTAISTDSGSVTGVGGAIPLSMNAQIDDVIIGALAAYNNDVSAWVGVTENFDQAFGASHHSGGIATATVAATPRTITATVGGTSAAVAALWR